MHAILQEFDLMKCHVQHLTDSQSDIVKNLKAANLFEKEAPVKVTVYIA
jgi:cytochrome c-type biogenesis protein CcmH/NrfF